MRTLDSHGNWRNELSQWKPEINNTVPPERYNKWRFVEWAIQSVSAPPSPTRPFYEVVRELTQTYLDLARQSLEFLQGLARWTELSALEQVKIENTLTKELPSIAADRYKEHYIRLAAQIPDFMVWTLLSEDSANREIITSLLTSHNSQLRKVAEEYQAILKRIESKLDSSNAALGEIPEMLTEMVARGRQDYSRATGNVIVECHRLHQLILDKPLLEPRLAGDLELIRYPSIEHGYINPHYRVTETLLSDEGKSLAQENWWEENPVREGLGAFLAGYFRTEKATKVPLMVLGDPGSGKSLLSKVLAARLPPDEFAVARVELRHVRSSQEISDQIDLELQRQTHNRYKLQDLTDRRGLVTRVIIMDGLDELLQLSQDEGLGRFLERLADFQAVESRLGHPVIAVATARTIVMDRIFVPSNITVVRLEGFADSQIHEWLDIWNSENAEYFTARRLEKLSPRTIGRHSELARQPLLLALLALYDAENNELRNAGDMSQAQLYERIFGRYLEREIEKQGLLVRHDEQNQQIEQRFRELSTIAMGMLNRGRKFVTREEVLDDFKTTGMQRNSTSASPVVNPDDAIGQFFFLFRAQARHQDSIFYEGYEFIHATFGEFLAARIIAQQLARAADVVRVAPTYDRLNAERHARSLLIPYLVRRPLVNEEQVLLFLEDIAGALIADRMAAGAHIAAQIPSLIRIGLSEANGYALTGEDHLQHLATLLLNLVLTSLRIARGPLPLSVFCDPEHDPVVYWRRLASLWKTHLNIDDWDSTINSLVLTGKDSLHLSYRRSNDLETRMDAQSRATPDHLRRMAQEGALFSDPDLRGAAIVWSMVRSCLPDLGPNQPSVLDELAISALYRVNASRVTDALVVHALDEIGQDRPKIDDLAAFLISGPSYWTDETLLRVGNYLVDRTSAIINVVPLLRIIAELDSRGGVSLARKLLSRLPSNLEARDISPSGLATVVMLSRRYRMPELLSRCIQIRFMTSSIIDWLSIEDISWMFESGAFTDSQLDDLRVLLRKDGRWRKAADIVKRFTANF